MNKKEPRRQEKSIHHEEMHPKNINFLRKLNTVDIFGTY